MIPDNVNKPRTRKDNTQGNTKPDASGFQRGRSSESSSPVRAQHLNSPLTKHLAATSPGQQLGMFHADPNSVPRAIISAAGPTNQVSKDSTTQQQPKGPVLLGLFMCKTSIHKINHLFQALCFHYQLLHRFLITLLSISQLKHLSTASAKALYLIE